MIFLPWLLHPRCHLENQKKRHSDFRTLMDQKANKAHEEKQLLANLLLESVIAWEVFVEKAEQHEE